MSRIPQGPEPNPQPVDDNKFSSTFKEVNQVSNTAHIPDQTKFTRISLRHKQISSAIRSKPSLALRLTQSKQILRKKASTLFCRGQRDAPAMHRNVLEISVPEAGVGRRCVLTTPDVTAEERAFAEAAVDDIGSEFSPEEFESAYPSTSTDPDSAPIPGGENAQHVPAVALSASPAASWMMTPASKIGVRESVLRRRTSFRTLTYDPSIPLVYSDEGAEGTVDSSVQELQTAGVLLSEGQAGSVRGVLCRGSEEWALQAQAKPVSSTNNSSNTAFIATSSAVSLSKLDSDAFDTALKLQANNNSNAPPSTSSVKTLLIHSDAIFLPARSPAEIRKARAARVLRSRKSCTQWKRSAISSRPRMRGCWAG